MAAMAAQSNRSLNPSAPEFFPKWYMNIHTQTQSLCRVNPPPPLHFNLPSCSPPFSPFPNPNYNLSSSYRVHYYSPFTHFSTNNTCSYPKNETNPSVLSQNYDHLLVPAATEPSHPSVGLTQTQRETEDQTQLVHEPKEVIGMVTGEVSPRGVKKGVFENRRSRSGGHGNGREKGFHENQRFKKEWKAKHDDGDGNCKGQDFSTSRRHAKSRFGVCRQKHPVVSIHPENTTVMIRNIPNRYTRELLMEFLDYHCMLENEKAKESHNNETSAFDFLYLPMDFEKKANKGYAFVNFTEPRAAWKFHLAMDNQGWSLFQSGKTCEIASARLQGKEELIRHFQSSTFKCETDSYLPVCFSPPRDGSKATVKQMIIGRRIG
ncbi:protein terminal ear1 homolog [Ricinus communis]|uniref:protein terminal ear1 homolog n=1 Tax=Ricinus communis TaxID=3988 RepID=UPI00201A3708|nr:protein terminal ear1 homolog [Ricinus communis]